MNIAQRIIALDEALDEVILSRGGRLADSLEFEYSPDKKSKGIGAGALGTAAVGGAAYAGSVGYRARKRMGPNQPLKTRMGNVMRGDKAKISGSKAGQYIGKQAERVRGSKAGQYVGKQAGKVRASGLGQKVGHLLKKLKFEEQSEDVMEFGMIPIPAHVYDNASPSKKAKIKALLSSRRAKIVGAVAGAGAAMGGSFAAGRKSKK
jgi:hypothetical protein